MDSDCCSDNDQFSLDDYCDVPKNVLLNFPPKRKPDLRRRELLAKPTIRHLLASGFYAVKTGNNRVLTNLENMLCCSLRNTVDPYMTNEEWREFLNKFVDDHRPASPDSDKFSLDNLDQPMFYKTYQRCRAHMLHTCRLYNYRAQPKRIASKVLNYQPTERILRLSKPRACPNFTLGRSVSTIKLRSVSMQRLNQRRRILQSELVPKGLKRNSKSMYGINMGNNNLQQMMSHSMQNSSFCRSSIQNGTMHHQLQNSNHQQNYFKNQMASQMWQTANLSSIFQPRTVPPQTIQTQLQQTDTKQQMSINLQQNVTQKDDSARSQSYPQSLSEQCSCSTDILDQQESMKKKSESSTKTKFRSVGVQCDWPCNSTTKK